MSVFSFLIYFAPVFLILIVTEVVVGKIKGRNLYSRGDTLASIAIAFAQRFISMLPISLAPVAAALIFDQYRLLELSPATWWYWPVLFFAFEFFYYWYHRLSHEIRWFWATHSVHHSIEEMNILAAYRFGWTSWLSMTSLVFLPLHLLGFDPVNVTIMFSLNLMYQAWLHTTLIPKLGPLEGILNTPSAHRVHHATNPEYLDRNHGGVLMIYDRMFGTYVEEREDEPCKYGLVSPVGSYNPVRIAFHEWGRLLRDLKSSPVRHWPGYLFGPPGWAPDGKGTTSAVMRKQAQQAAANDPAMDRLPRAIPRGSEAIQ